MFSLSVSPVCLSAQPSRAAQQLLSHNKCFLKTTTTYCILFILILPYLADVRKQAISQRLSCIIHQFQTNIVSSSVSMVYVCVGTYLCLHLYMHLCVEQIAIVQPIRYFHLTAPNGRLYFLHAPLWAIDLRSGV